MVYPESKPSTSFNAVLGHFKLSEAWLFNHSISVTDSKGILISPTPSNGYSDYICSNKKRSHLKSRLPSAINSLNQFQCIVSLHLLGLSPHLIWTSLMAAFISWHMLCEVEWGYVKLKGSSSLFSPLHLPNHKFSSAIRSPTHTRFHQPSGKSSEEEPSLSVMTKGFTRERPDFDPTCSTSGLEPLSLLRLHAGYVAARLCSIPVC